MAHKKVHNILLVRNLRSYYFAGCHLLRRMKRSSSMFHRVASLLSERRLYALVALVLALCVAGCASDNMATKSPEDGSDYPGWTKAASTPFTLMSHQQSF